MADQTFNCIVCHDAKMVHSRRTDGTIDYSQVVPCLCMRDTIERARRQRLLSWCELPPASDNMTLECFKVGPGLQDAYRAAQQLASGELNLWLTLISETNRGKTHLAAAICRAWLERGVPARYAYVPLLLDEIRRGYQVGDGSYESRFDAFLNVPLLVLDDLGVEHSTPWVQEKLDTIVDYRMMHDLALVVTTNKSLSELSPRIVSRLRRNGRIITIAAPEHLHERT